MAVTHRAPGVTERALGVTHGAPGVTQRALGLTHRAPGVPHRAGPGPERERGGFGTGARTRTAGAASLLSPSGAQPCRVPPHRGTAGRPGPSAELDGAGGLGPTLLLRPPAHGGQWWLDTERHGPGSGLRRCCSKSQALCTCSRTGRAGGTSEPAGRRAAGAPHHSPTSSLPPEFTSQIHPLWQPRW